jgi:cytoskeletal protein RodZ
MNERKPDPPSRAAAALAARRGQLHALRMRVAVFSVSIFIAAWAVVFVRLVEGHDPALASTSGTVVMQSADPDAASDDTADNSASSTSSASSSTSSAAAGGDTTAAPTAVTTRQS